MAAHGKPGVDGALPGKIMPANPQTGMKYREEYYFGHAEDEAEIIGTGLSETISLGTLQRLHQNKKLNRT